MIVHQGYQIKPFPNHPKTLVVATDGRGGSIPACLEGLYTSVGAAKLAIDSYLISKPEKATDGRTETKTIRKSRD